jgi:hypothetical protein
MEGTATVPAAAAVDERKARRLVFIIHLSVGKQPPFRSPFDPAHKVSIVYLDRMQQNVACESLL